MIISNNNEFGIQIGYMIDLLEHAWSYIPADDPDGFYEEIFWTLQYEMLASPLLEGAYLYTPDGGTPTTQDLLYQIDILLDQQTNMLTASVLSVVNTINQNISNGVDINTDEIAYLLNLQTQAFSDLLLDTDYNLSTRFENMASVFTDVSNQTRNAIMSTLLNVDNNISSNIGLLDTRINNAINNSLITTTTMIDDTERNIVSSLSSQTDILLNEIRNIGVIDSGGGGTTNTTSAWTSGYIVDLLSVLDDFRQAFIAKDMSPLIENIINVNGDGTGTGDTPPVWDENASVNLSGLILDSLQDIVTFLSGNNPFTTGEAYDAGSILQKAMRNEYSTIDEFFTDLNNAGLTGSILSFLYNIANAVTMIVGLSWSGSQPYRNNFETLSRTDALDGLIPLQNLIEATIRQLGNLDEIMEGYKKLGLDDNQRALLLQTAKIQLPEQYLRSAYLRNEINKDQWQIDMQKLGYVADDLPLIEKLIQNVPPISDAILFAVREVYDEQLVGRLQLDSNYDTISDEFEKLLSANGIDKQYAKYYWRAHWRLPSPTQFYEMFWRDMLTSDELLQALQVSDYSPQWQEKLRDIAYREYPRVDIRRMHKLNLLTDDEVKTAYKRIGFDDEKATNMQKFTLALNGSTESETVLQITTSQILTSLNNGLIDENLARENLLNTGYNDFEVNLLLSNAKIAYSSEILGDVTKDNHRRIITSLSRSYIEGILPESYVRDGFRKIGYPENKIDDEINVLKIERDIQLRNETNDIILNKYLKYQITITQASAELSRLGYSSEELTSIMELWQAVRDDRKTVPTEAKAKDLYENEKISLEDYRDILRARGLIEKYVLLYA